MMRRPQGRVPEAVFLIATSVITRLRPVPPPPDKSPVRPPSPFAKRLEDQQRSRDPQLQVVTNKAIELKGHKMQQLDSIISAKGQTAYSSVILGNVGINC